MSLKEVLPREHGTWAMLLVPWAVGCGVAHRLGAPELLLLVAIVLLFLAHNQLLAGLRLGFAATPDPAAAARVRRRLLRLAAAAAVALAPLLVVWRLTGLLALGAVALGPAAASALLVRSKLDRGEMRTCGRPDTVSETGCVSSGIWMTWRSWTGCRQPTF